MLREEFIKNLVEDKYITSAIMYRDHEEERDKVILFVDKDINIGIESPDFGYIHWFLRGLDALIEDYRFNNGDYELDFDLEQEKHFDLKFDSIQDSKEIYMFKTIEQDGIIREYSDLFNERDLTDHISVGMVILDVEKNKVLMLDHIKCDMITIPVGKGEEGETPFEAVCKEVKEETNLDITTTLELCQFDMITAKNNRFVKQFNHLFITDTKNIDISKLNNNEPNKHRDLFWMDLNDLLKLKTKSFMTNVFADALKNNYIITKYSIPQIHTLEDCRGLIVLEDGIERSVGDIKYKIKCRRFVK